MVSRLRLFGREAAGPDSPDVSLGEREPLRSDSGATKVELNTRTWGRHMTQNRLGAQRGDEFYAGALTLDPGEASFDADFRFAEQQLGTFYGKLLGLDQRAFSG